MGVGSASQLSRGSSAVFGIMLKVHSTIQKGPDMRNRNSMDLQSAQIMTLSAFMLV